MTANAAPIPPVAGSPTPSAPQPPTARPLSWNEDISIWQPRQAAFWLFAILLLLSSISFADEQLSFANASTTAWIVGLVLLALYAVPVYWLINTIDLFEREPRSLLIGALLWGAIVATVLAGQINDEWSSILQKLFGAAFTRDWGAALVGPGIEELLKFLGVVVIYLIARAEFDDVLDGFVYGAMVGLGFTLAEDMYYFFTHFVGDTGLAGIGGLLDGFFTRIIVGGPYSHVLLTGLTGMGLAYYVTRPDVARQQRVLVAVALYLAGVAAHFVWNSPLLDEILGDNPGPTDWILWAGVKGLPFLILLGVLVRIAMRRERRLVGDALAPEVASGVLTDQEVTTLESLRARRAARKAVGHSRGAAAERLVARLQHAQIALAVAAAGSAPDRETRLNDARTLIAALRGQLAAVPAAGYAVAPSANVAGATGTSGASGAAASASAGAALVAGPPPAPVPFAPNHYVPPEGLPSWAVPDPAGTVTPLAGGLPLQVDNRLGDWAHVRASNGWVGWVDGRRLLAS
jgi:RsiW-degrading membrane proteinase PrsW (M82 family)